MRKLRFLLLLFPLFAACTSLWREQPYTIKDGHERMVAILDSIARYADPQTHPNLSSKWAETLKKDLKKTTNDELVGARVRYALELVRAGEEGQAVIELANITRDLGDSIVLESKPVYELLALAYLRMGEVENSVERSRPDADVLPIGPKGYYTDQLGINDAIKVYRKLLKSFPNDLQNRWLLNLAYMHKGMYPDSVPEDLRLSPELFERPADFPQFTNKAAKLGLDEVGLAGGACMEDFDLDGDLDLFVVRSGLRAQCRYYVQENGQFRERTSNAHLDGITGGIKVLQTDFDNDGDADLLILRGGGLKGGNHPNSLLRNNGNNSFTDVTIEAGLLSFHPTMAADWADYDGDGWLDLYVANESRDSSHVHPNELYHNNGNGTFTEVGRAANMNLVGYYQGAVWGDINNDRRPDLFLSNWNGSNQLWVNKGSNIYGQWQFQNSTAKAGLLASKNGTHAAFFDADNDGDLDLLSLGYELVPSDTAAGAVLADLLGQRPRTSHIQLYLNSGNETFTTLPASAGLGHVVFPQSCEIADFDNDGWLDLYVGAGLEDIGGYLPNRLFRNLNGQRFEEVSMCGAAHLQKGHGVAAGDLDNDGDTDLYLTTGGLYEGDAVRAAYFQNDSLPENHQWVQLVLRGQQSNASGKGAKVAVTVQGTDKKKRTIWANCGSGTGGSQRIEMGLGKAARIVEARVYWPHFSELQTVLDSLDMNKIHFVQEQPAATKR